MCPGEEKALTYKVAGTDFLIVNLRFPWVKNYKAILAEVVKTAEECGCNRICIWYTRKATEWFLLRRGWTKLTEGTLVYVWR